VEGFLSGIAWQLSSLRGEGSGQTRDVPRLYLHTPRKFNPPSRRIPSKPTAADESSSCETRHRLKIQIEGRLLNWVLIVLNMESFPSPATKKRRIPVRSWIYPAYSCSHRPDLTNLQKACSACRRSKVRLFFHATLLE
jgi:hypothetical protein